MPKHNKPLSGGNNWNRKPDKIKHNKKRNNNPWSQNYGQEEESSVYGNNIPSYKYSQPQLRSPEELLSPVDENGQKLANFASRVAVNVWQRKPFVPPQSRLSFSNEKSCNCDKEQENDFLGEYSLPRSRTGLSADNVHAWESKITNLQPKNILNLSVYNPARHLEEKHGGIYIERRYDPGMGELIGKNDTENAGTEQEDIFTVLKKVFPCKYRKYIVLDTNNRVDLAILKKGIQDLKPANGTNIRNFFNIAQYLENNNEDLVLKFGEEFFQYETKILVMHDQKSGKISRKRLKRHINVSKLGSIPGVKNGKIFGATHFISHTLPSVIERVGEEWEYKWREYDYLYETIDRKHHILVSKNENKLLVDRVNNIAHELLGHFYMYTINKNPSYWGHIYAPDGDGEPVDTNIKLVNQINKSVDESDYNHLEECP